MTTIRPATTSGSSTFQQSKQRSAQYYYIVVPSIFFALVAYHLYSGGPSHTVGLAISSNNISGRGGKKMDGKRSNGPQIKYIQVDSGKPDDEVLRYAALDAANNHSQITTKRYMELLSEGSPSSTRLAEGLSKIIQKCPFEAVFFETMGVHSRSISTQPFEFVLVNSRSLARFAESNPDQYAFEEHLNCEKDRTCCVFDNLGGDARLIAPRMIEEDRKNGDDARKYSHLAAFVRGASKDQVAELWRTAASEYLHIVQERGVGKKTWFSTSGMGIAWLHIRLDSYPKYYQYGPFKSG